MKMKNTVVLLLAGFTLTLFAGCDNMQTREVPEGSETISVTQETGTRYYSLNPFMEITEDAEIKSTAWDLAFSPDNTGRVILTNSGSTAEALGSGGKGGVWHTEKLDIEEAGLADRKAAGPREKLDTDNEVYLIGIGGGGVPFIQTINVMTYLGWEDGEGTQASPYSASPPMAILVNKANAFITSTGSMPPAFSVTGRVYVLRHGIGGHNYSLIRIAGYTNTNTNPGAGGAETYILEYRGL